MINCIYVYVIEFCDVHTSIFRNFNSLLSIMMIPVYCVCAKNHMKDVSIFSNIYQKDLSFEDMLFKKHSINEKGQYAVMQ